MAVTGDIWGSNATDDAAVGTTAWGNITNFNGNTTSTSASCTGALGANESHYANTDHVHGLTPSDTITGIAMAFERKCDGVDGPGVDTNVYLRINGTRQANNKASASSWPTTKAFSATYGSAPTTYWGAASNPTGADALGFSISANTGGKHSQIDIYRITAVLTYTTASGSSRRRAVWFGLSLLAVKWYAGAIGYNAKEFAKEVFMKCLHPVAAPRPLLRFV